MPKKKVYCVFCRDEVSKFARKDVFICPSCAAIQGIILSVFSKAIQGFYHYSDSSRFYWAHELNKITVPPMQFKVSQKLSKPVYDAIFDGKLDCDCNPMFPSCKHIDGEPECETHGKCFEPEPCDSPYCIHRY